MSAPLAKFMKKLDGLPGSVKSNYERLTNLDTKCVERRKQLENHCLDLIKSPIKKQTSKQESKNNKYSKALNLLQEMENMTNEKLQLASACYEEVDRYIIELDKAYSKFTKIAQVNHSAEKKSVSKSTGIKRKKNARQQETKQETSMKSPNYDNPLVEMPVDPNEPTYCFCHQVSFGQMIMCDNKNCTIEWFHFQCVGLNTTPKGKWYCDTCKLLKRGRKSANTDKQ